jgi:hypothetical protein
MRPKNTSKTKWRIDYESWHPTKKEAMETIKIRKIKQPYDIEHMPYAKTMWGNYRKDKWRVRTYSPTVYEGKKVITGAMTYSRAMELKKFHTNRKLVKIRGAYYFISKKE